MKPWGYFLAGAIIAVALIGGVSAILANRIDLFGVNRLGTMDRQLRSMEINLDAVKDRNTKLELSNQRDRERIEKLTGQLESDERRVAEAENALRREIDNHRRTAEALDRAEGLLGAAQSGLGGAAAATDRSRASAGRLAELVDQLEAELLGR